MEATKPLPIRMPGRAMNRGTPSSRISGVIVQRSGRTVSMRARMTVTTTGTPGKSAGLQPYVRS